MTFQELEQKSILILGFGTEGQATYEFLRRRWPAKSLGVADRRPVDEFPEAVRNRILADPNVRLHLGPDYLDIVKTAACEVIIKTPGIPASLDAIACARASGCRLTSHSQIFLSNYPRARVIGITGTKGKSTTASLIHHILTVAGVPAELVGNIGQPPLTRIDNVAPDTYFVHEFSSHQLAEIETSPHIAVLLNIVPEHLDYYANFAEYIAAKENITRFQTPDDYLIFAADYPVPSEIANRSKAALLPIRVSDRIDHIIDSAEIPLRGRFNVLNIIASMAAAGLCGVQPWAMRDAIRTFRPLQHRLEPVGTYDGITFVDDSIATVPDATLAAIEALGSDVSTLLLGGHERNLDFRRLGEQIPAHVKTLILFPPTGVRIWKAIETYSKNRPLPDAFFVRDMEQAVRIAYERTEAGKICLLSPASPSFGIFRDYRDRGESFKAFVKKLSSSGGMRCGP